MRRRPRNLERREGLDRHIDAPCSPVADPERQRRRHTEEVGLVTGKIDEDRGVDGMGVAERECSGHGWRADTALG